MIIMSFPVSSVITGLYLNMFVCSEEVELPPCFVEKALLTNSELTILLHGLARPHAVIELTFNYYKQFWSLSTICYLFTPKCHKNCQFYGIVQGFGGPQAYFAQSS